MNAGFSGNSFTRVKLSVCFVSGKEKQKDFFPLAGTQYASVPDCGHPLCCEGGTTPTR